MRNKLMVGMLSILLLFAFMVSAADPTIDELSEINEYQLSEKADPSGEFQLTKEENEKRRIRTFEVGLPGGKFAPEALKGEAQKKHFQQLSLPSDVVYIALQFEGIDGDPTSEQVEELKNHGIAVLDEYITGDHTYIAKAPKSVLASQSFDFVRWMDVIEDSSLKIHPKHRTFLQEQGTHEMKILFYEPISGNQLEILKELTNSINERTVKTETFVVAEIDIKQLPKILEQNFVRAVVPYLPQELYMDGVNRVLDSEFVWDRMNDGDGVTVGVIDTGIVDTHDHFDSVTLYDAEDYVDGGDTDAECGESDCSDGIDNDSDGSIDEGIHGNFVAGIVSGMGTTNGRQISFWHDTIFKETSKTGLIPIF